MVTLPNQGFASNRDFVAYFQESLDDWAKRKSIQTEKQKEQYFSNFEKSFQKEISTQKPRRKQGKGVLITSEHFSSRLKTIEELNGVKKFLLTYFESVKVICYVRPQVEMATSHHWTGLNGQGFVTLEQKLLNVVPENDYYNLYEMAKKWAYVFGRDNLQFRIYETKRLLNNDIRYDFLEALKLAGMEIDSQRFNFDYGPANESLSTLQGTVFAAVNKTVRFWNKPPLTGVNQDNLRLKKAVLAIPKLSIGKYSAENQGEVQSRFEESNKKYFDEFLPGESFELSTSKQTVDSIPFKEVEQLAHNLTKTLLSETVNSNGATLVDSDAEYLRDMAISILDKKPLSASDAHKLLELAMRVRPEGPVMQKQLARAEREIGQK